MDRQGSILLLLVTLVSVAVACFTPFSSHAAFSDVPVPWQTLTDSTVGRTEVAAARVGRFVYVVGGFREGDGQATTIVERYDLQSNTWRRTTPLPIALHHSAAVSYRGNLYVIGGYTAKDRLSAETGAFWRYSPQRKRWQKLKSAPLPTAAHAAAVIGHKLYVVGGVHAGKVQAKLQVYDFQQRRWFKRHPMLQAREHFAVAVAGGALYVLAGRTVEDGNLATAERYLPKRNRWQKLPAMAKSRGGIAAAVVNGWVMVVGGEESAGTIREVEGYKPSEKRWLNFQDLPTPRHGLAAVGYKNKLYVFEGGVTPGLSYSRKVEALKIPPANM